MAAAPWLPGGGPAASEAGPSPSARGTERPHARHRQKRAPAPRLPQSKSNQNFQSRPRGHGDPLRSPLHDNAFPLPDNGRPPPPARQVRLGALRALARCARAHDPRVIGAVLDRPPPPSLLLPLPVSLLYTHLPPPPYCCPYPCPYCTLTSPPSLLLPLPVSLLYTHLPPLPTVAPTRVPTVHSPPPPPYCCPYPCPYCTLTSPPSTPQGPRQP